MATRTIKVDNLARVEGEGRLYLKVADSTIESARLEIFEPPRFFEAFLRGRAFTEVPDITARICGICPVAYQMSSVNALESLCGVTVGGQLRALRRILYCGEWIESHVLHIYMLHAPDFLGLASGIEIAKAFPGVVERALRMKKIGNTLINVVGGREIHPINVRVGGFYRTPTRAALRDLLEPLAEARELAAGMVRWAAALDIPEFERDYEFVSLRHDSEYPMAAGRIVSSEGLDIAVEAYEEHFEERHVPHSTALHSVIRERGNYLVGPLARFALNRDRLSADARDLAAEAGLTGPCRNPFRSIVVRAVEVYYAIEEAIRLIEAYEQPEMPHVPVPPRAATGFGATEAPRGLLFHRYRIDGEGNVLEARIVPPTSQNQPTIEDDLRGVAGRNLDLPNDALRALCEQTIRNYDPCISCATHFLKLEIERD